MYKDNFYYREQECSDIFNQLGEVYNTCTPENHPIIFKTENDYKTGMSILAICAKMYQAKIQIYAFQLMSNHIHLVIGGSRQDIMKFFAYFKDRLGRNFNGQKDLNQLVLKLFPIEDLAYFRNSITYVNRNAFVVSNSVTPFSYPWGTSAYFFQPIAYKYTESSGKPIGILQTRQLMHTKNADMHKHLLSIDGYISPLEFCNISIAEKTFRDAKQYFYLISRNIETYANIAKTIGESIFYSDGDLFLAASKLAKEYFGATKLETLPANQKIELAKRLHYDYNANDKQLQRMFKIDSEILKSLF